MATLVGSLMPINDRLKGLRKAAGLTQQALATKAGLSMSAVIHLEAGRIPDPRLSTIRALAKAMGVTLDALAGEEDTSEVATPEAEQAPPTPKRGRKAK